MTNINRLSIFGDYSQKENRITTALLHIFNVGKEDLIRFFMNKLNIELPTSNINISSQDQQKNSVPDGSLECSFKFKIFIESKIVQNAIDILQMENHLKKVKNEDENFLVYLTPHSERPTELEETIEWENWSNVLKYLDEYVNNNDIEEGNLLKFLVKNFETLLENHDLITGKWNWNDNKRVAIFAGGGKGENDALTKGQYICPNQSSRKIQPVGYIGFYKRGFIRHVFKVETPPRVEGENLIYDLGNEIEINEIKNDKLDKHGRNVGWMMGRHRYTTLKKIQMAKLTSDLE